jgi:Adenosine deaminase
MINQSDLFMKALKNRDMESLRRIPKTDLHNHFYLGGHRDYILKRTGHSIPPLTRKLNSMAEMHQWVGKYINDLFETAEKRILAIEACFQQAKDDGVTVLETGDDVWTNCHFYQGDIDKLINTFQKVHHQIAPQMDFRFQIGLSRHCPIKLLEEWIAPFLEKTCFCSLDLSGDEMAQPIKNFKPIYRKAKDKGVKLTAHVGEWGDADSVKEAVEELELDEVQHGIAAANSPEIMKWLADNKIQLNICPTSNVMLNRVNSLKEHPIRVLFDYGVRVTINSDDVLVFGQSVSKEYLDFYEAGVFNAQELNIIRKNGLASRGVIE